MGEIWIQTKLGEDNEENLTLGNNKQSPLYYDLGIKHHHLIMSALGEPRGRLERERERCPFPYRVSFLKRLLRIICPVEGWMGGDSNLTNLRVHILHIAICRKQL